MQSEKLWSCVPCNAVMILASRRVREVVDMVILANLFRLSLLFCAPYQCLNPELFWKVSASPNDHPSSKYYQFTTTFFRLLFHFCCKKKKTFIPFLDSQ